MSYLDYAVDIFKGIIQKEVTRGDDDIMFDKVDLGEYTL